MRKETLQEWFGQTKGDTLFRACRGDDPAPLAAMPPRKSIGIEVTLLRPVSPTLHNLCHPYTLFFILD